MQRAFGLVEVGEHAAADPTHVVRISTLKMQEADFLALENRLQADRGNAWREIVCELHYGGDELPIFVLVETVDQVEPAFERVVELARPWLDRFDETEPTISFSEYARGEFRTVEFCDAEEVRSGRLNRIVGRNAITSDPAHSVFASVRAAAAAPGRSI